MKTIITLAIGFWIGRQIYINYDKDEARKKEARVKKRLSSFLQDHGLTEGETEDALVEVLED